MTVFTGLQRYYTRRKTHEKTRSKLLTIIIALVLVLAVGCASTPTTTTTPTGGTTATTATTAPTTAPTVNYDEHEEFTLWLYADPTDYYTDYSENPVVKLLNEKFNVTLKFQQPPSGTESDALSLMLGTGEYTDAIELSTYTGSWAELYEDGVVVDLAEYLDYMPNLVARMEADDGFRKTVFNDDGQILSFRSLRDMPELVWGGLVYRYDILDTMTGGNVKYPSGNAEPTTIADLEYMLPLFKMYFEAAGITEAATYMKQPAYEVLGLNYAITSACKNIPKLVSILDYLYSEEGSMIKNFGLTKEMGAAEDPVYKAAGLEEGYYWFEGDKFVYNPKLSIVGGQLDNKPFFGLRLPGYMIQKYQIESGSDLFKQADAAWSKYISQTKASLPATLSRPADEDKAYTDSNTRIMEYLNAQIPKFIMGTATLDDAAWSAFKTQLVDYGAEDNIAIQQAAYDRYKQR